MIKFERTSGDAKIDPANSSYDQSMFVVLENRFLNHTASDECSKHGADLSATIVLDVRQAGYWWHFGENGCSECEEVIEKALPLDLLGLKTPY